MDPSSRYRRALPHPPLTAWPPHPSQHGHRTPHSMATPPLTAGRLTPPLTAWPPHPSQWPPHPLQHGHPTHHIMATPPITAWPPHPSRHGHPTPLHLHTTPTRTPSEYQTLYLFALPTFHACRRLCRQALRATPSVHFDVVSGKWGFPLIALQVEQGWGGLGIHHLAPGRAGLRRARHPPPSIR